MASGDSTEKIHSQQYGVIFNEESKENLEGRKMNDEVQKKTSNDK